MKHNVTRRSFIQTTGAGLAAAGLATAPAAFAAADGKPAILGGKKIRSGSFPSWPVVEQNDEQGIVETFRSKKWFRGYGEKVNQFEQAYAGLMGAKHCVAVTNGTSALFASLSALDVGPGDEVIVPPYTFVATISAVLLNYAIPVFVDTDPKTFQIDAGKIEAAITDRTAAILPVHIGGYPADLDTICAIGKKRNIPVIEDACQAHMAEWKGKKIGTLGTTGCFSFQASKNLNSGEGGAVLTNDGDLAQKVYAFHNNCRGRAVTGYNFSYIGSRGANLRMTEFQGSLLLSQMTRVEAQAKTRNDNAQYLSTMLRQIPGVQPAEFYPGVTRGAFHLYMFRINPGQFGCSRAKFIKALQAEGISCSTGYSPLNKDALLTNALASKAFKRIYPKDVLANWEQRTACPVNEKLCQDAVWFTQSMLLGSKSDMEQIVDAIRRIQAHAAEVAKA